MTIQTRAAHFVASVKHTVKSHLPHDGQASTNASPDVTSNSDAPVIAKTQKAHLAEPQFPGHWLAKDVALTGKTLAQVTRGDETTDPRLAHGNDVARVSGGVLIAALAGLFAGSATLASKEALGLVTWFGVGMTAAPLVINKVMKHTTGVDFGQHYVTSYNGGEERERLLNNPEYLPVHLIPEGQQAKFMAHEGIDPNLDTDAKQAKLSGAIQKKVIQHNTLWMLVAGPATAVVTALTCHTLEPLLEKAVPRALHLASQAGVTVANWTGKHQSEALDGLANRVAGKNGDSRIAQWWGEFAKTISGKMDVDTRILSVADILHPATALAGRNERLNQLAEHVLMMSDAQRAHASEYLTQQATHITDLGKGYSEQANEVERNLRQALLETVHAELPEYANEFPAERLMDLNPDQTLDSLQQLSKRATETPLAEDKLALINQQMNAVAKAAEQRQEVQTRLFDGLNTVSQYQSAINKGAELGKDLAQQSPEAKASATAEIRQRMERANLPVINQMRKQLLHEPIAQLLDQGLTKAQQYLMLVVGHEKTPSYGNYLARLLNKEQVQTASDGVGATPLLQLNTAVKETLLQSNWRSNAGLLAAGIGAGTIAGAFALTPAAAGASNNAKKLVTALTPSLGGFSSVSSSQLPTGGPGTDRLTSAETAGSSTLAPLRLFNPTSSPPTNTPSAAPMVSPLSASTTASMPPSSPVAPIANGVGAVNPLPASSLVGVL